jgi:hypothetical protein
MAIPLGRKLAVNGRWVNDHNPNREGIPSYKLTEKAASPPFDHGF